MPVTMERYVLRQFWHYPDGNSKPRDNNAHGLSPGSGKLQLSGVLLYPANSLDYNGTFLCNITSNTTRSHTP